MNKPHLGIIGGGQLALYLIQSAHQLDLKVSLVCNSPNEPAAKIADAVHFGSVPAAVAIHPDLKSATWTFENEFLEVQGLDSIDAFPRLKVLDTLRNKRRQKLLLEKLGIPSSEWIAPNNKTGTEKPETFWQRSVAQFGDGGFVLKWSEGGYDGHGTYITKLGSIAPQTFLEKTSDIFAEKKIAFDFECALVGCRDRKGKMIFYPLVVSEQDNGICRRVFGPATAMGVSPALQSLAESSMARVLTELDYVGCLAIEFFFADGNLLVNEIAPRVHNTGHYSMDAASTSQFENHVRAVMDLDVLVPTTSVRFAMTNILGPDNLEQPYGVSDDFSVSDLLGDTIILPKEITAHWYGKSVVKSRRKLGHLNLRCEDAHRYSELNAQLQHAVAQIEARLADPTNFLKKEIK